MNHLSSMTSGKSPRVMRSCSFRSNVRESESAARASGIGWFFQDSRVARTLLGEADGVVEDLRVEHGAAQTRARVGEELLPLRDLGGVRIVGRHARLQA